MSRKPSWHIFLSITKKIKVKQILNNISKYFYKSLVEKSTETATLVSVPYHMKNTSE